MHPHKIVSPFGPLLKKQKDVTMSGNVFIVSKMSMLIAISNKKTFMIITLMQNGEKCSRNQM